jgi:hypothetical protein
MINVLCFEFTGNASLLPISPGPCLNLRVQIVDNIQQSMLIAPNPSVLLLCVSPTFEQLPHGHHHPAVRAIALQDTQRVRRLHKAHAQLVRWASERKSRQPDHARETARHVEIGAFGLCVCRVCSAGGTPLAQ